VKLWRDVRHNPVMIKELRGRMRGRRAFVMITVYAIVLSLFALGIYLLYAGAANSAGGSTGQLVGKIVFGGVVIAELLLVCFVTPALTANAISGERERQTFDMLCITLLPPRSLVHGKLLAALSYIILLIVTGMPLQSLAFFLGGVVPEEIILSLILLFVTAVVFAIAGLFFSVLSRTSLVSTVLSYAFVLAATTVVPLLGMTVLPGISIGLSGPTQPPWFVEAALVYILGFAACTNPLLVCLLTEVVLLDRRSAFFFKMTISGGHEIWLISPWIVYSVLGLLLSLLLLKLSSRLLVRRQAR